MKRLVSLLLPISLLSCSTDKTGFVGNWVEVIPYNSQIVQGFALNADGTANSINLPLQSYEQWRIEGDKIIVNGKGIDGNADESFADTLAIIEIAADSIILENSGMQRIGYFKLNAAVDIPKSINVIDSLKKETNLGKLVTRTYQGLLPAASGPGIEYIITLYNYEHSGDGVYKAIVRYLEAENGKDQVYNYSGRMYTLRGDATDKDATVYQLISFEKTNTMNFLYKGEQIELLNTDLDKAASGLNYSLTIQN